MTTCITVWQTSVLEKLMEYNEGQSNETLGQIHADKIKLAWLPQE